MSVTDLRTSAIAAWRSSFLAPETRTAVPWMLAWTFIFESLITFTMLFAFSCSMPALTWIGCFTLVPQPIQVKAGIEQEKAKSIVKVIKDSKMKVQASIQGTAVRVSGAKKDDLQAAIALVRKSVTDIPLQFQNFRD